MTCKIITVMPIAQGAGCKFMTTSLAYGLKQQEPNKKIALLDFDFYEPFLAATLTTADKEHRIDNIIDKIASDTITNSILGTNFVKVSGLFDVLKGTKLCGKEYVFNEKHITTILDYVKNTYDYCFISVAPFDDNAGTVFGLNKADKIVLVSQMNDECRSKFSGTVDIAEKYAETDTNIFVVYNFRSSNYDIDFSQEILKHNKVEVAGSLPFIPSAVDHQNIKPGIIDKFVSKGNGEYKKLLKPIVEKIFPAKFSKK